MKKEITGYITGIINSYTRTIERLKANGAHVTFINSSVAFKEELTDLLEFVIDIPDSKEISILSFNIALENEILKKRIAELEESCSDMCEIEKNLHEKNKELEANFIGYRGQFIADKQKIKKIETQNKSLKHINKRMHKQIKILRNER